MDQVVCQEHGKSVVLANLENGRVLCQDCQVEPSPFVISIADLYKLKDSCAKNQAQSQKLLNQKMDEFTKLMQLVRDILDWIVSQFQMDFNEANQHCDLNSFSVDGLCSYLSQFATMKDEKLALKEVDLSSLDKNIKKLKAFCEDSDFKATQTVNNEIFKYTDKYEYKYGHIDKDFVDKPLDFTVAGFLVCGINKIRNNLFIMKRNAFGDYQPDAEITAHSHEIYALQCGHQSNIIVSGGKSELLLWELVDGAWQSVQLWKLSEGQCFIISLAISYDESIILAGWTGGFLSIYKCINGKWAQQSMIKKHSLNVECVAINSDNTLFATGGGDKIVKIRHMDDQKLLQQFTEHKGIITSIIFSRHSKWMVTGAYDEQIIVWGQQETLFFDQIESYIGLGRVNMMRLSPDESLLFSMHERMCVLIWKIQDGRLTRIQEIRRNMWFQSFQSIAISQDSKFLAITLATHQYKQNFIRFYRLQGQ